MPTFEQELVRMRKPIRRLTGLGLLFKTVHLRGGENFVRTGPNLIVGNHIGSYKDVGLLFRVVPRPIFFTANKDIFKARNFSNLVKIHLHRHLGRFGGFVHLMLRPWYAYVVQFISSNIASIGSIPVSFDGNRMETILRCQDYLRQGRAVIALQGRGRIGSRDRNPYVKQFRRGVAFMSYNLLREGIAVPVTPLSIFGTHVLFGVPSRIRVNVGPPMFLGDYFRESDAAGSIEEFRQALESRVTSLLLESLRWEI